MMEFFLCGDFKTFKCSVCFFFFLIRAKWRWCWKLWKKKKWRRDLLEKAETSQTWIQNWNHPSKNGSLLKQRSGLFLRIFLGANNADYVYATAALILHFSGSQILARLWSSLYGADSSGFSLDWFYFCWLSCSLESCSIPSL